jgi:hypothetical protein
MVRVWRCGAGDMDCSGRRALGHGAGRGPRLKRLGALRRRWLTPFDRRIWLKRHGSRELHRLCARAVDANGDRVLRVASTLLTGSAEIVCASSTAYSASSGVWGGGGDAFGIERRQTHQPSRYKRYAACHAAIAFPEPLAPTTAAAPVWRMRATISSTSGTGGHATTWRGLRVSAHGDRRKRPWRSPKPGMPITETGDGDRLR